MAGVSELAIGIAEEIKKRTECEHYRLVLNEERVPKVTDSKIGGRPYWPSEMKYYPADHRGEPMLMVMQINCGEAGLKAPMPEQGMLQWFISLDPDRQYGCRGNYDDDGDGFCIVYHNEVTDIPMLTDLPCHDTVEPMLTPVKREVAIDVVSEQTNMGVDDGHFNRLFFDIVKEITGIEHVGKMWYGFLNNDECLYFEQNLGMRSPCHQLLGYPVYEQEEARRDMMTHDVLLMELASQFSKVDGKELVMWGDMGNGLVFVNHEDLAALDFSRPYYCWDCG